MCAPSDVSFYFLFTKCVRAEAASGRLLPLCFFLKLQSLLRPGVLFVQAINKFPNSDVALWVDVFQVNQFDKAITHLGDVPPPLPQRNVLLGRAKQLAEGSL